MPIKIVHVGAGKYTASVTPSKYRNLAWSTDAPVEPRTLIDRLLELGYHQQDIGDAFYEANPDWL
jgi:hypothetical protein